MKESTKLIIVSLIVVGIIGSFVVFLAYLVKVNSQCMSNPFSYGAKSLEDQGFITQCQCSINNQQTQDTFYYDSNGIYEELPYIQNVKGGINLDG